jgi:hypothetical protein
MFSIFQRPPLLKSQIYGTLPLHRTRKQFQVKIHILCLTSIILNSGSQIQQSLDSDTIPYKMFKGNKKKKEGT